MPSTWTLTRNTPWSPVGAHASGEMVSAIRIQPPGASRVAAPGIALIQPVGTPPWARRIGVRLACCPPEHATRPANSRAVATHAEELDTESLIELRIPGPRESMEPVLGSSGRACGGTPPGARPGSILPRYAQPFVGRQEPWLDLSAAPECSPYRMSIRRRC